MTLSLENNKELFIVPVFVQTEEITAETVKTKYIGRAINLHLQKEIEKDIEYISLIEKQSISPISEGTASTLLCLYNCLNQVKKHTWSYYFAINY